MDGYMSVKEAAERMGVSRQRVNVLIKRGKLGAERVSERCWLVREADLKAYMAAPRDKGGRPRKQGQ